MDINMDRTGSPLMEFAAVYINEQMNDNNEKVPELSSSDKNLLRYKYGERDENIQMRATVISNSSNYTPSDSSRQAAQLIRTPARPDSNMSASQVPQSKIIGDVALTPTHSSFTPQPLNPHSAMTALTPMASGVSQAKHSIKLQNCVSTVSLGCELKLLDIYCRTRFSEYNPSRFQGVVMKILDPRATALVFRSGKIVCTGARNEHDSYLAARKFARIIQKLGFPAKFLDFKIQNFIATADLRFPVRLEALQQAHGQFTSYEPELFPGLVYRMVRPRVVLLIFVNGKIVFTASAVMNKWSNIRDTFIKSLKTKSGQAAKKKYIYSDNLQFLLKTVTPDETDSSIPTQNDSESRPESQQTSHSHLDQSIPSPSTSTTIRRGTKRLNAVDAEILKAIQANPTESESELIDDDRAFMISLLPSVKELNDDDRFDFRIEVMQLLRRFKNRRRLSWSSTATPSDYGNFHQLISPQHETQQYAPQQGKQLISPQQFTPQQGIQLISPQHETQQFTPQQQIQSIGELFSQDFSKM